MSLNPLLISLLAAGVSNLLTPSQTLDNAPVLTCVDEQPKDKASMQGRIRSEFFRTWRVYKEHAWGHDELKPLSLTHKDWHSAPLLITAVESIDTLLLMGFNDEAQETIEYISSNLRFDHDMDVGVFEVNIRVLGGLLSAYQLTLDKRLLVLAKDLADRLLPAFDSPTGMPYTHVNLKTQKAHGNQSNPAEIGSYILEFGALSRLTGNPIYFDKAKRALVKLYGRRSEIGLVGSKIDIVTGKWIDTTSHIGGGIDSYYEYLFKAARLFDDKECKSMWEESKEVIKFYLAEERKGRLWHAHVHMDTGERVHRYFSSLDAFMAGLLTLDGNLDDAKKLQATYYEMWTKLGALPESIDYDAMRVLWDPFLLRPEIIESAFYLHRATKDTLYIRMGERFFCDLIQRCRSEEAFHALSSLSLNLSEDQLESFFFSETMKYLYLLFASESTVDLSDVVFTTEGHLMKKSMLRASSQ